jgi:hypothetical protein
MGSAPIIYMHEVIIQDAWRGKGIGSWALPRLFLMDELKGISFMFTWPTVLNSLEAPGVNGPFGEPTPSEMAAYEAKRQRIIKFYRQVCCLFLV